jgi:hypothetical protein
MHHACMTLTQNDVRRVCVEAECDPRSVTKYLGDLPMRPMTEARIRAAMVKLGFEKPAKKAAKKGGAK